MGHENLEVPTALVEFNIVRTGINGGIGAQTPEGVLDVRDLEERGYHDAAVALREARCSGMPSEAFPVARGANGLPIICL